MRRTLWLASFAGAAGLAVLTALMVSSWTSADPAKSDAPAPAAASRTVPQLPVTGCALFSSGVGYFQREGEIDGNARVDLTFPVGDINDLLKSMVLQDLGGGHIDAVSYDSHDPVVKTLKSFAINLSQNPSVAEILDQARGEKIEVVQQQAANQPGTLTGTIIGIEQQRVPLGKDNATIVEILNLWCAEGMRAVKLAEVQRLRFLNPVMETEFRKALDVLALSHDTQKKAVSLSFSGEGKRPVRVGYVIENPIWKSSYRLVLDKEAKPYLQGWAVVENPTDEDWKDVHISLIAGRPISFQMDLYQPLYVSRPTVVPELFASLTPRTYEGKLDADDRKNVPGASVRPSAPQRDSYGGNASGPGDIDPTKLQEIADIWGKLPVAERDLALQQLTQGMPFEHRQLVIEYFQSLSRTRSERVLKREREALEKVIKLEDVRKSVNSAATGMQLGDSFMYRIERPVNLARQKSAMLPIVAKDIEGTKVSIYNQSTQAKFPLLGLKFKNTSGVNLMQGPITVFENDTYAGDSRIMDLQPGEERLLSYAMDLGTEVEPVLAEAKDKLTKVKLHKGLLFKTTKERVVRTYKAKNRTRQDRLLIIEHPYDPAFKIVSKEQPSERARDVYRFEVTLPADNTASLEVAEERDVEQSVQLTNSDDQAIRFFINQSVSSEKVKAALQKAIELRTTWAKTQQNLAEVQRQVKDIVDDQTRLRANMRELPQSAPIYKKYLDKFEKQEGQIEEMQATIKTLQDTEHKQRQEYDGYLGALDVE
jgi:hypothetical protein